MGNKVYEINETVFKLKEKFTTKDWASWNRLDKYYSNLSDSEKNGEVLINMSPENFKQHLTDILIDDKGEPLSEKFIEGIPLALGLPLIIDFFFSWAKLNKDMQMNLRQSQKKVIEQVKKLKG